MVYDLFVEKDFVAWLRLYHPHYLPSDIWHDEEHHQSGSESVRDENELPPSSDSMTSVSSDSPSASQSLASARKTLSSTSVKMGKPPGRARVLTSKESLAITLEKEQKKKEEEEAKERRKLERIEKKLQRDYEMKKKAEERELMAWSLKLLS